MASCALAWRSGPAGEPFGRAGTALAITISWSLHHSIVWAVIHGVLSWLYVVYYVVTR